MKCVSVRMRECECMSVCEYVRVYECERERVYECVCEYVRVCECERV